MRPNVRIENVVHRANIYRSNEVMCGQAFGPDVAWIRYEVGNSAYRYLAHLPKEVEKPTLGEVVGRPPDGVETFTDVTCLVCLGLE